MYKTITHYHNGMAHKNDQIFHGALKQTKEFCEGIIKHNHKISFIEVIDGKTGKVVDKVEAALLIK